MLDKGTDKQDSAGCSQDAATMPDNQTNTSDDVQLQQDHNMQGLHSNTLDNPNTETTDNAISHLSTIPRLLDKNKDSPPTLTEVPLIQLQPINKESLSLIEQNPVPNHSTASASAATPMYIPKVTNPYLNTNNGMNAAQKRNAGSQNLYNQTVPSNLTTLPATANLLTSLVNSSAQDISMICSTM
jgi:hypothetical protein